jgi:hypothetical protein
MAHRKIITMFAITMIIAPEALADPGVPDLNLSTASLAYPGPETVVMFNVPNGGGTAFPLARILDGWVDATVTLHLRDSDNNPVVGFPRSLVWLDVNTDNPEPGTFSVCPTIPSLPDGNSDAAGIMTWTAPLHAGGWNPGPTVVMISGSPLLSGDLNIGHVSADINGDLVVNLTDVQYFAVDFFSVFYSFRSDLHYDGTVGLADLPRLAQTFGAFCY